MLEKSATFSAFHDEADWTERISWFPGTLERCLGKDLKLALI